MEEKNKIQRTELYKSIYKIVSQIPKKNTDGDSLDYISASRLIEDLINSEVCLKSGTHTCSGKKKYHVYSFEEIRQIRKETIDDYKNELLGKIEELRLYIIQETGSLKWDSCYYDCIDIIKK